MRAQAVSLGVDPIAEFRRHDMLPLMDADHVHLRRAGCLVMGEYLARELKAL